MEIDALVQLGETYGLKLELVRGIGVWEALPTKRHQGTIFRIQSRIRPIPGQSDCSCIHYSDVLVRFAPDTLKRPDIAVWCVEPDEDDVAITALPAAVIEVISVGYEAKDLEQAPALYLGYGVLDVVIVDPRSGLVVHHDAAGTTEYQMPVMLDLHCGCRVDI